MKRVIPPVLIIIIGIAVTILLMNNKKEQKRGVPRMQVRTVASQTIKYSDIRPSIEASGRVRSRERIQLTPEVSGTIMQSGFSLFKGMAFQRGQILVHIDNRQAEYALRSTISDLLNALAGLLPELKTDIPDAYERWQGFFTGLSAENIPELPETSSQREKLLATRFNIFKLYYAAQNQRLSLDKHVIRAPFSGTVEDAGVYPSSLARAGVAIAAIARTDEVEIEIAVPSESTNMIQPGTKAIIAHSAGNPIEATVHRISDVLEENMQTVSTFIRVKNAAAQGLRSGAYVTVTISGTTLDNAVKFPRKALYTGNRVYIIHDGNLAERTITPAYLDIDHVYVSGGIEEGAVLVTEPLQDAVVGMRVQTIEQAAAQEDEQTIRPEKNGKKSGTQKERGRL